MASTEPTLPMIRPSIALLVLLGTSYLFSSDRRKINLRVVVGGLFYKLLSHLAFYELNGLNLCLDG